MYLLSLRVPLSVSCFVSCRVHNGIVGAVWAALSFLTVGVLVCLVLSTGMGPDVKVLVKRGRKAAQQYYRTLKSPIPVRVLVRELAAIMQEFTQSGCVFLNLPLQSPLSC
mgnify:CR=1 FL=1